MKKYLGLDDISNTNCSSVLHVIRQAGTISRKGISDETGLSWAGMTKIVNKLFEKGFLEESKSKTASTGVGRIPNLIRICRDKNIVLGIDINREGFRGCVCNLAGEIHREYSSMIKYSDKEDLIGGIIEFISNMIQNHKHQLILAIGVAMQGELDIEEGISMRFPDCDDWSDVRIREILQNEFGYKVYIEHDPNSILYSWVAKGNTENSILFRMDRSIGMAAYIDGAILRGRGILEVKNCIIGSKEDRKRKLRRGSLEAYVWDCMKDNSYHEEGMKELIPPFVNFIYNMAHVFQASNVILTGELMGYKVYFRDELYNKFQEYIKEEEIQLVFMDDIKKVVYGAALIAVEAAINDIEV